MSVRDIAAKAWWKRLGEQEAEALKVEQKRRQAEREKVLRGQFVLDQSPLGHWFPDAKFDIIDYTGMGTSLQYQSDGSDIIVESDDGVKFALGMNLHDSGFSTPECIVYVVALVQASSPYRQDGPYYSGPRVTSAEEVGRWLAGKA